MSDEQSPFDPITINEAQLVLAEKRTALAVMRTGIALLALPLTIISFLVATSKYYEPLELLHYLIPVALVNLILVVLGLYLLLYSLRRIWRHDRLLKEIKRQNSVISPFLD